MATTEVQRLVTRLEATHKDFERDMKRARSAADKQLKRIDDRVSKTSRGFGRFGKVAGGAMAGILTAAAARSLINGIQGALDKLDDIAKTAGKIGLTTDALQELRVAADLSGVSATVLDKAMIRFSVGIDETRRGMGEAKDAFEELGISFDDTTVAAMSMEQLLNLVADRFTEIEDPIKRTAIASDLFGTRGVAMVNMLKDGAGAIDRMRAKARELGIVIDADLIRRSVEAKDELSLLKQILDTKMVVALAGLAPHLIRAAGLLAEIALQAGRAADGWRLFIGLPIADFQLGQLANEYDALEDSISGVNATIERLGEFDPKLASAQLVAANTAALTAAKEKRETLVAELETLEDRIDKIFNPAKTAGSGASTDPDDPAGSAAKKLTPKEFATNALADLAEEAAALELRIRLIGESTRASAAAEAEERILSQARRQNIKLTDEHRLAIKLFAGDIGELAEQEEELREKTEGAAEAIEDQSEAARDARQDLADMFGDAIAQAETLDDALTQIAKSLAELAIKGLFGKGSLGGKDALGGIFGSIAEGLFGGGTSISNPGGGSAFTGVRPGREHGGPVRRGQSYVVGEKRPELFVPDTSGVIVPRVPEGGTTINVSQTLNFSLGVTATVRSEIAAATPGILAASKAGVAEAVRRGGKFAKGIRG